MHPNSLLAIPTAAEPFPKRRRNERAPFPRVRRELIRVLAGFWGAVPSLPSSQLHGPAHALASSRSEPKLQARVRVDVLPCPAAERQRPIQAE